MASSRRNSPPLIKSKLNEFHQADLRLVKCLRPVRIVPHVNYASDRMKTLTRFESYVASITDIDRCLAFSDLYCANVLVFDQAQIRKPNVQIYKSLCV